VGVLEFEIMFCYVQSIQCAQYSVERDSIIIFAITGDIIVE
jgi:hypothetical protein